MIDRDRQLDRLAKLLALESSPNAPEAASARRAAEALMKKHGLRREDASGRSPSGYYEHPMGARGWGQAWRFTLVTAAARHCGCEAVALLVGRRRKVRVAGVRSDVERAVRLYEALLGAVRLLGRGIEAEDLDPGMAWEASDLGVRACSDSFRRGVVLGIVEILSRVGSGPLFRGQPAPRGEAPREARPPREAPAGDDRALVRVAEGRRGQSDRVRSRYQPDEVDVRLDDAPAWAWFKMGHVLSLLQIEVREDDSVVVEAGEEAGEAPRGRASRGGRS